MANLSTLTDQFTDNTVDAVLWPNVHGGATEVGGRARVPCVAGADTYAGYLTADTWTFDQVHVQAFPATLAGATSECYTAMVVTSLSAPEGTDIAIIADRISGTLRFASRVTYDDPDATSVTYSATTHAWWRLRRNGGNVLFETAPDSSGAPGTWTTRSSIAMPAWLNSAADCSLLLESHRLEGTDNFAEFDNVNTTAASAAAASSLVDTFSTGSIDTAIWTNHNAVTVSGGAASVPCVAGTYSGLISVADYYLAGSQISAKVTAPTTTTGSPTYSYAGLGFYTDHAGTDLVRLYVDPAGGLTWFYYQAAGATVWAYTATYDPTAHAWLRIREAAGTIYGETSANGLTWSVLGSNATPATVTASTTGSIELTANRDAGSGANATFDNLNSTPAAAPVTIADPRAGLASAVTSSDATVVTVPPTIVADPSVPVPATAGGPRGEQVLPGVRVTDPVWLEESPPEYPGDDVLPADDFLPGGSVVARNTASAVGPGQTLRIGVTIPDRARAATATNVPAFTIESKIPGLPSGGQPHVAWWLVDGTNLIPLPHVLNFDLSPQRNSFGSVQFEYPVFGKNYDLLRRLIDEDVQLEAEIWIGGSSDRRMRCMLLEASGDDVAENATTTVAGHFLEWLSHDAVLAPDPADPKLETWFVNESPGTVVSTLWAAAQARGTLTSVSFDSFTNVVDSNGVPWSQLVNLTIPPQRPYDEILSDLVDTGVIEWEITPDHELKIYEPGSRGEDLTTGVSPTTLRRGVDLTEAKRKFSNRDAGTDLWVAGGQGLYDHAGDATARARYGRQIERADSQNYILDDGALAAYIGTKIGTISGGAMELTAGLVFGAGRPQPRNSFDIGDWIYIDVGRGSLTQSPLERYRVAQWSLKGSGDQLSGTISLNDLMSERISRLEKLVKGVTGGAVVVGTSLPTDDGKAPAAPTGLGASTLPYFDASGTLLAAVTANWSAVSTNADGTTLFDMSGYRLRYRYITVGPAGFIDAGRVSSLYTTHTFSGLLPGAVIALQVQAYDRTELESTWSTEYVFTTASDATAPPIASAPVATNYLGVFSVAWDGKGAFGEVMPQDFSHAEIHVSTAAGFTPDRPLLADGSLDEAASSTYQDRLNAAGEMPIAVGEAGYGIELFTRLVLVDKSNNAAAPSAVDSATPGQVGDGDVAELGVGKLRTGIMTALMTIAGIIRTATSGARVELDAAGFRCYSAADELLFEFNIPGSFLNLRGRLEASSANSSIIVTPGGYGTLPAIQLWAANAVRNATLFAAQFGTGSDLIMQSSTASGGVGYTYAIFRETFINLFYNNSAAGGSAFATGGLLSISADNASMSVRKTAVGGAIDGGQVSLGRTTATVGIRSDSTGLTTEHLMAAGGEHWFRGRFPFASSDGGRAMFFAGYTSVTGANSGMVFSYGTTMADSRAVLTSWNGGNTYAYVSASSSTSFTMLKGDTTQTGYLHFLSMGVTT